MASWDNGNRKGEIHIVWFLLYLLAVAAAVVLAAGTGNARGSTVPAACPPGAVAACPVPCTPTGCRRGLR